MFAALAVSATCVAVLWLWAVPAVVAPWTFALMVIVMMGGAIVSLLTWRNAQPTSTVAQLLQATEAAGAPVPYRRQGPGTRSK